MVSLSLTKLLDMALSCVVFLCVCIMFHGVHGNRNVRPPAQLCPNGSEAPGLCVDGACGAGFTCDRATNLCCPQGNKVPQGPRGGLPGVGSCPNNVLPVGQCINGACGEGFKCNADSDVCCPNTVGGKCPDGRQSIGACANGVCARGFVCINKSCCYKRAGKK